METDALLKAMKTSISDVLETMFFMPVEFEVSGDVAGYIQDQREPLLASVLRFEGAASGSFTFIMPAGLARTLTANFLGVAEPEVHQGQMTGTLMEILNMISGRTFGLYDDQAVFDLGVPQMIDVHESPSAGTGSDREAIGLLVHAPEATLAVKAYFSN